MPWPLRKHTSPIRSLRLEPCGCTRTYTSLQQLWETTMNHSIIFRPFASAAVLALVAVSQPGLAALSQAASLLLPQAPVQVKVEGRITAVNAAAGTITVQHDDGGPAAVVALGAARGTFYVGQEVEVAGIRARAGSNGATVQAQFIRLKSPDGD